MFQNVRKTEFQIIYFFCVDLCCTAVNIYEQLNALFLWKYLIFAVVLASKSNLSGFQLNFITFFQYLYDIKSKDGQY